MSSSLVAGSDSSLLECGTPSTYSSRTGCPASRFSPLAGPGVPALAACYAASRALKLTTIPVNHAEHPGSTEERRDERLVGLAHAAVLVGGLNEVRGLVGRVLAKRMRMEVIANGDRRGAAEMSETDEGGDGMIRGLPD